MSLKRAHAGSAEWGSVDSDATACWSPGDSSRDTLLDTGRKVARTGSYEAALEEQVPAHPLWNYEEQCHARAAQASSSGHGWAGPLQQQHHHQQQQQQQHHQHAPLQATCSGIGSAWAGGACGGAAAPSHAIAVPPRPAPAAAPAAAWSGGGLHRCASAPELPALADFMAAGGGGAAAAAAAAQPAAVLSHQRHWLT